MVKINKEYIEKEYKLAMKKKIVRNSLAPPPNT